MKDNNRNLKDKELNSSLSKKQRKILRVKKVILDSASELFSNNTYESVSMNDIADQAALSRATLYNYFTTKEAIFFEIGIQRLREVIEEQKLLFKSSSKSGLERVMMIFNSIAKTLLERSFHHKIIIMFFLRLEELNILDALLENFQSGTNSVENKLNLESYEEHIMNMINIYVAYQNLLNSEIRRGKADGSIKCSLSDFELYSITNVIYFGTGDFVNIKQFRKYGEAILNNVLNLLEKILTNQIQLK